MAKMTYGQLHGVIMNDNTNIESMIRGFINESANASVVAVYDDSLVLLDTLKEEFYTCNYHYNPDTLSIVLEGFEPIELEEDNSIDFKLAVKDYLISESDDSRDLLNSYMKTLNKSKSAIESLVAESIADKDYSNVADFEELSFINEEFEDLRESEFFQAYQERLLTHPLNNVLVLDWETPVAFTLLETTEPKSYINSKSKEKAKKLCASKKFKKQVCNACAQFVEDVEEGGDMLVEMFSENPSLFSLNSTELKEAVAKSIMLDPTLNEDYKKISEAVVHYVNNDESFQYLREAIDIDDEGDDKEEKAAEAEKPAEDAGEEKKNDEEKKKDDDKAVELTAEDKEKLISALKTVSEKVTDEKIKKMVDDLLDELDTEDDGTKVESVKEAVRLLSL
jgi:hypothetical protein